MRVRRAGIHEIGAIIDLLIAMHVENGLFSLSEAKMARQVRQLVLQGSCYAVLDGDRIVGIVGLDVATPWYSDERHVGDYFLFIHPDYRSTDAGDLLIEAGDAWAAERGMKYLSGPVTPDRPEVKMRWYRSRGFKLIGGLFLKER